MAHLAPWKISLETMKLYIVHPKILVFFPSDPESEVTAFAPSIDNPFGKVESKKFKDVERFMRKRLRLPESFFHTGMAKPPSRCLKVDGRPRLQKGRL